MIVNNPPQDKNKPYAQHTILQLSHYLKHTLVCISFLCLNFSWKELLNIEQYKTQLRMTIGQLSFGTVAMCSALSLSRG